MGDKIFLRGTRADIQGLRDWLAENVPANQYCLATEQRVLESITARKPLRQAELFDVVLALTEGVVASALYDVIKARILKAVEARKLENLKPTPTPERSKPSPLSSRRPKKRVVQARKLENHAPPAEPKRSKPSPPSSRRPKKG